MTDQEELQSLLDRSAQHVYKQGRPSGFLRGRQGANVPPSFICLYKADDCGCAAAPFIVNYKEAMEKNVFGKLADDYPNDLDPVALKHAQFVESVLQKAHDDAARDVVGKKQALFVYEYRKRLFHLVHWWHSAHYVVDGPNVQSLKVPARPVSV